VPLGKRIHFYVAHGEDLLNNVGMAVEGFDGGIPPEPFETFVAGAQVHDYILTYPSDLRLNGTRQNAQFDWITVRFPGQAVPLSVLLRDTRCQRALDIHWAACRGRADWLTPHTHDAGYAIGNVTFVR